MNSDSSSNVIFTVDKVKVKEGTVVYNGDSFLIDKFDLTAHAGNTDFHVHLQGSHNDHAVKITCDIETTNKQLHINIINLQIGKSDLSGELLIAKDPMQISGKFIAKVLKFKDFSLGSPSPSGEYSIPNDPFPVAKIRNAAFDVTFKIDLLDIGGIDLQKVTLNVKNV